MSKEGFIRITAFVSLPVVFWLLAFLVINGSTSFPTEGDSLLHIHLANDFLSGRFLHPNPQTDNFYPASSEMILALLLFFKMPLNLYNVFAIITLAFISFFLGVRVGLSKSMSILFAVSLVWLHGIERWGFTQKPDIWMIDFVLLFLYLLLKKEKSVFDYFLMGVSGGFFVGAKFTGILFLGFIIFLFRKKLQYKINPKKTILFVIPFTILGLFWYIRNLLVAGNPFYFQGFSPVANIGTGYLSYHAWQAIVFQSKVFVTAFFSEFMLWPFGVFILPIVYFFLKKNRGSEILKKIILVCFLIFATYLFLPSGDNMTQMIGSMRYIFSGVALMILGLFLFAQRFKHEELIIIVMLSSLVFGLFPPYHPKLLFPIFIFITIIYFLLVHLKIIKKKAILDSLHDVGQVSNS